MSEKVSRRKYLKYVGAGAVVAAAAAAGGYYLAQPGPTPTATVTASSTPAPTTLNVLTDFENDAVSKVIAPEFDKQYNAKAVVEEMGYAGYHEKAVTTLVAGGYAYDVFYNEMTWAAEFSDAGYMMPLDEYFTSEYKESLLPTAIDQSSYAGPDGNRRFYIAPFLALTSIFFYRKDLFDKAGISRPPRTWKEWAEDALAVQNMVNEKGFYGLVNTYFDDNAYLEWCTLLNSNGGRVWDYEPELKPAFNTTEGIEALQFMVDLVYQYKCVDPASLEYGDTGDKVRSFCAGLAATTDAWDYAGAVTRNPKESQVVGLVESSTIPGNRKESGSLTAYTGWSIPTAAKNKDLAWKFIAWRDSTDIATRSIKGDVPIQMGYPMRKEFYQHPELSALVPEISTVGKQLEYNCNNYMDPIKFTEMLYGAFVPEVQNALQRKKDPEEALTDCEAAIYKILGKK